MAPRRPPAEVIVCNCVGTDGATQLARSLAPCVCHTNKTCFIRRRVVDPNLRSVTTEPYPSLSVPCSRSLLISRSIKLAGLGSTSRSQPLYMVHIAVEMLITSIYPCNGRRAQWEVSQCVWSACAAEAYRQTQWEMERRVSPKLPQFASNLQVSL